MSRVFFILSHMNNRKRQKSIFVLLILHIFFPENIYFPRWVAIYRIESTYMEIEEVPWDVLSSPNLGNMSQEATKKEGSWECAHGSESVSPACTCNRTSPS